MGSLFGGRGRGGNKVKGHFTIHSPEQAKEVMQSMSGSDIVTWQRDTKTSGSDAERRWSIFQQTKTMLEYESVQDSIKDRKILDTIKDDGIRKLIAAAIKDGIPGDPKGDLKNALLRGFVKIETKEGKLITK